MRRLRQLSMAAGLAFVVSAPAFAGIVGGPPAPEPAPTASSTSAAVVLSAIQIVLSVR